ncbi:c-type cytochrome [Pontibaca salina]|uniref:Cytochrome c n=1 Tax=Pontibaca salina TaxID=2795731 RepID=A0A934LXU1_9RHOB|nr:cytochrome c [Pontibaca salina]MBI6629022.1 cytochrome c [Pontibaca salina]
MKFTFPVIGGLLVAGIVATTAISQDDIDPAIAAAVKARQAHMKLNAFNLGLLGAMAKGEIDYDAEAAVAAAENLAALARMDETRYWPEGSDMEVLGKDHTEALAALWADDSEFGDRAQTMAETTAAMAGVAGNGLEPLQGAMGPLAKACGGCHEDYRVKDE